MQGTSSSLVRAHFDCQGEEAVKNYFHFPSYACNTSFFGDGGISALSPGVGYGVVLAFGLAFGGLTIALVYLDQYFFRRAMNSEYFNTAGRSVRTGLTASVIVSQWTWASTLLQSSNVAFQYGVSGPLWYAAGASVQIILFSSIAVLVKLRAPTAHTFLEIIRARWGTAAHLIFLGFALITNFIVTGMLVLGGSDTIFALTNINRDLSSFLIPLGVILYTLAGGLKATFVASYFNTGIILVALVIFIFEVYVFDDFLGSPGKVWDQLNKVLEYERVEHNRDGSYLTMFSQDGFFFGLVNILGNFGAVLLDQTYWQSAIAATPSASWKGYILGGLCWFAVPFSLATSLGLAAVALSLPISVEEAEKGLVPLAAAKHLLGTPGSALILVMLFMAVTSSGASEQIAFSSLISYDVYRAYINPECSGQSVIALSRAMILVFGMLSGVFGIVLHWIGVNLSFLYFAMGVFIGPAVVPVAYSILWGRASARGAISGALSGLALGLTVWLSYGASDERGLGVESLKRTEVMLAGNLTSILSSAVVTTLVSLLYPDDCDWSTTRAIPLIEDDPNAHIPFEAEENLEQVLRRIATAGVTIMILLVVVWPLLSLPAGVFSKWYFTFWVILSFVWGTVSCVTMILLPLIESRYGILTVISGGKLASRARRGWEEDDDVDVESMEDFVIEER